MRTLVYSYSWISPSQTDTIVQRILATAIDILAVKPHLSGRICYRKTNVCNRPVSLAIAIRFYQSIVLQASAAIYLRSKHRMPLTPSNWKLLTRNVSDTIMEFSGFNNNVNTDGHDCKSLDSVSRFLNHAFDLLFWFRIVSKKRFFFISRESSSTVLVRKPRRNKLTDCSSDKLLKLLINMTFRSRNGSLKTLSKWRASIVGASRQAATSHNQSGSDFYLTIKSVTCN